ncbi:MAG: cobalt-zinc-cadmium efflux system outer membrane protein [Gammaproteobacteria bacterium]|jgi:cobalt-zinc-cadmium efflux system outer membrane protein
MWVNLAFRLLVGLVCLIPAIAADAETTAVVPGDPISFSQAIKLTLERNPILVAAGYQSRIATANVVQAGLRPPPQLGIVIENLAGTGPFSGLDGAETTVSLAWVIERGKRERRLAYADAGISIVDTKQQILRLDVSAETARRYLECLRLEENVRQASEAIALAESTLEAVNRRVERGRSPTADRARADAELSRTHLRREEYEHSKLVALRNLAEQWGVDNPAFDSVAGRLGRLPTLPSFEALLANLESSPDQELFVNERQLRESELLLQQAKARPDWRISTGIRRLETTNDHAFVASINIPLGYSNRNQGNIEAARVKMEQTTPAGSAAVLRTRTQLFAVHQELKHSLHEANALRDDIIPKLELALRETKRAYSAGRYGFYEISLARSELLSAKAQLIDAEIQALSNLVEIERLTGMSIDSSLELRGES